MSERIAKGVREFFELSCNRRWLNEIVHVLEIMNRSDERKERYGSVMLTIYSFKKVYFFVEKREEHV
jgi:hypothetical protein